METYLFSLISKILGITLVFDIYWLISLTGKFITKSKGRAKVYSIIFFVIVISHGFFLLAEHPLDARGFITILLSGIFFSLKEFEQMSVELILLTITHPILIISLNIGAFLFGLENGFITTVLVCALIFFVIFLVGYYLSKKYHKKWVAIFGIILAFGLFVNASVFFQLLFALFIGYYWGYFQTNKKNKSELVPFLVFSFFLITIYVYIDHVAIFGQFYSFLPSPEILVLLASPLFLTEGFLFNKLLANFQTQDTNQTFAQHIYSIIPDPKNQKRIISYSVNLIACIIFSIISHFILRSTTPTLLETSSLSMPSVIPTVLMPMYFYLLIFLWGIGIFTFFEYGKGSLRRDIIISHVHLLNLDKDTTKDLLANSFNIPTTFPDVLDLVNPFAWLRTIFIYIKSVYTLNGTLFKLPVFESKCLNFAWQTLSIPCFSIFIVLAINGFTYYPDWINKIGISNPIFGTFVLLLGLCVAYYMGKFYSLKKPLK
jgi:hypothetical protein